MIWLFAVFYQIIMIGHFGWNWKAESDAELICDGVFLILLSLAYISNRSKQ